MNGDQMQPAASDLEEHPVIQILLLDDHTLFREGLARLLDAEPGMAVVGSCTTIDDALAQLSLLQVDVVLLDYDLGTEVGTGFLKSIAVLKSAPRVLLVTAGMPDRVSRDALEAGAVGIVLKHSGPRFLIEAIRRAAIHDDSGGRQSMLHALTTQTDHPAIKDVRDRPLTRRQATALRGILDGLSNKEIAELMKTSESSVKAILQELFQKAGVRTRSQLVRVAIERHSADWIQ